MNHLSKKVVLTQGGLDQLKAEYQDLVEKKRPQVTKRISKAREFGDLSENSEYDAAKEEQSLIEARISQLEDVLPKAQVAKEINKTDFVVVGSSVIVEMDNEIHDFSIVGSIEADPAVKKISNESPVGKALLTLKAGESIDIGEGPVKRKIKLLEIK